MYTDNLGSMSGLGQTDLLSTHPPLGMGSQGPAPSLEQPAPPCLYWGRQNAVYPMGVGSQPLASSCLKSLKLPEIQRNEMTPHGACEMKTTS